jgi:hypothetical protein
MLIADHVISYNNPTLKLDSFSVVGHDDAKPYCAGDWLILTNLK